MSWFSIEIMVLQRPCHEDIRIEKWEVQHPSAAGFSLSMGEPQGQKADYRKRLHDGRSLHVREFEDYYLVHWDNVDPSDNPIGHLLIDAPHWVMLGIIGLGIIGLGFLSIVYKE